MIQGDVLTSLDVETLTVLDDALFAGDIQVKGHVAFNEDTVGQAKILAGDTEVRIEFEDEYVYQPIISLTPMDFIERSYKVDNITTSGFDVKINGKQEEDVVFSWYAFGSDSANIFVSDGTKEDIEIVMVGINKEEDEENESGKKSKDQGEGEEGPEIGEDEETEGEEYQEE